MKKKILLIFSLLLFMTNVKALSFNVNLTGIEDKGNNSTVGQIRNIDVANKKLDLLFQTVGDEVNFELTITNSGDRAGSLKKIEITSSNDKIEYTHNLPENGLAINGNDTNKVLIKAKVKDGATSGKSSSVIKITYNYDEGSCPEGEILSDDETKCLCPNGKEKNENGVCVEPPEDVNCEEDQIYNEIKKICEDKVIPPKDDEPKEKKEEPKKEEVVPSNPKTIDNIVLITLLFVLSGLALYALLFKRLKNSKMRIMAGSIIGIVVASVTVLVLSTIFGFDGLLGAIINPITKKAEIIINVDEEIEFIEVWDGECSLDVADLTPENIFDGGSGTENDPYKVANGEQLSCFAKSVNNGTTYEGQYIKQTKNIKLNDRLNEQVASNDLSNAHLWTPAGYRYYDSSTSENVIKTFAGIYNGDNNLISGLYITNDSISQNIYAYKGLFGHATNATFKNIIISDAYVNTDGNTGALLGYGYKNLTLDNVNTYGTAIYSGWGGSGVVSYFNGNNEGILTTKDTTNNINIASTGACAGIVYKIESALASENPTIILRNNANNGNIVFTADGAYEFSTSFGYITSNSNSYLLAENNRNTGSVTGTTRGTTFGGILGYASVKKLEVKNSYNSGTIYKMDHVGHSGGIVGKAFADDVIIENCFNSGNFDPDELTGMGASDNVGGIVGYASVNNTLTIKDCYNTGNLEGSYAYLGGIIGALRDGTDNKIENCYNTGKITGYGYIGGLVGDFHGTINKSYNTGLVHSLIGPRTGGLVGWGSASIYNSYNEGDIIVSGTGSQHGGLCSIDCKEIKNSYNRGNITVYNSGIDIGGIVGSSQYPVTNVYNSGTITYMNDTSSYAYIGGIISSNSYEPIRNAYNLGDIIVNQNGDKSQGITVGGISAYAGANSCVNKGSITVKINQAYNSQKQLYLGGISGQGNVSNSFNAGNITLDDEAIGHSILDDGHQIFKGEIRGLYSVGDPYPDSINKYNTDPNGKAIGCIGIYSNCTDTASEQFGTYTTESAPDILSIINGDNAFEIKEGETLPTLKVFNQ